MRQWLWINFAASAWILIAYSGFAAILLLGQSEAMHAAYGPFAARVMLWPLGICVVEGILWFRVFRYRGSGARIMAATTGVILLVLPVTVYLLIADLYDRPVDWFRWTVLLYVGLSHLAFGMFDRRT